MQGVVSQLKYTKKRFRSNTPDISTIRSKPCGDVPVVQWQNTRLLIEGSEVQILSGTPSILNAYIYKSDVILEVSVV